MASDPSDSNSNGSRFKKNLKKFINRSKNKADTDNNENIFDNSTYANLETSKQKMIKGVMELSDKNAREIMIPRVDVLALTHNTTLKTLLKIICNSGYSRIPVYQESIDNIIGILYIKDLLKYIIEKPKKFQLKSILHKPFFVPDTMPLDDLLFEFKKKKQHLAIVVDEYGGMNGVITLEDIIEEIVGEIKDEFDDELPEIQKINKNIYKADSRMAISDFNEGTGLNLPTDDFDTIGGFVFDLFGKVPQQDETIKYDQISFKINDIKGTRINQITITIPNNRPNQ